MEYILLAFVGVCVYLILAFVLIVSAFVIELPYWLERALVFIFNPAIKFWYWVAAL